MRVPALWASLLLALGFITTVTADSGGVEYSVVRILNFLQRPDWYAPWDAGSVYRSSGSGFVINGGLVMTNAHVVSNSRMVLFYLHGDPNPHKASVHLIGHDCDLALLKPEEEGVLNGVRALEFGGLPALRSTVETYGYPAGGEQMSSTRGVVSRIEMQGFAHSTIDQHLAVQTDAAINPGNSGGPVIQDGKVVGVAFQGMSNLEGAGFFIPTEVIGHFLADAADGRYDGYPELGAQTSSLLNPAARSYSGLKPGESGVLVDRVIPKSSADGILRPGDVILDIEGQSIANDGSVALEGLRLDFGVLADRRQAGENLRLTILREGQRLPLSIPLRPFPLNRRLGRLYDQSPRFFIYGGLIFVPLDREMMGTYGNDWLAQADNALLYEYLFRPIGEPERMVKEQVVLLRRLDHAVNINMAWYRNLVVERVNGRPIEKLEDLVEAFSSNTERFHLLEFASFSKIGVLDREQAEKANPEILERYGVPKDRNL